MKQVRLNQLTIENFKGTPYRQLDFCGRSSIVYGDNASGKSTLNDAWHWLLFGKNRKGLTSFNIKPLDIDGKVRDSGATTSVTAAISIDGEPFELKRTYYEKWSQKRGSADRTFDGNTSDFFIDSIPCRKSEFDAKVASLIAAEDVFLLLTNLHAFNEKLTAQSRRKVLFELCGTASDAELIAANPALSPLAEVVGRYSVEDYRKKLQSERRTLNEDKLRLPTRIDECLKLIANLKDTDFAALRDRLDGLRAERQRLSAELVRLENNSLLAQKRNELTACRNELTDLENRNRLHRASQTLPRDSSVEELHRVRVAAAQKELAGLSRQKAAVENEVFERQAKISQLRKKWYTIEAETLRQDTVCPTCGRDYDPQSLSAAKREFEQEKLRRQAETTAEADALSGQLAGEAVLKSTNERIAELRASGRALAGKLEENDRMQYLCEEFVRFKVSFLEERVNAKFRVARFKLFDTQVNGALVDCCEATYNGVPYDDINSGMAVNIGLDIINTVSEYYGVRVPMFIDNAESVTRLEAIETQVIRLTVSEKDRELRCIPIEEEERDELEAETEKGLGHPAA